MALRSIHVTKSIIEDMEQVCPHARLFNYTNPINIVSEAVTHHTYIPIISFCEGPIVGNRDFAKLAGLDPGGAAASDPGAVEKSRHSGFSNQ